MGNRKVPLKSDIQVSSYQVTNVMAKKSWNYLGMPSYGYKFLPCEFVAEAAVPCAADFCKFCRIVLASCKTHVQRRFHLTMLYLYPGGS